MRAFRAIDFGLAAVLLLAGSLATAGDERHRSAGGLEIYYGIVPAELVFGHETEHGGSKITPGAHHLVVALFNAVSGERVVDASVEAIFEPLGLAAETKMLEPMTINQTVTYGNFFRAPGTGPYWITVRIRPRGATEWIETRFEYRHP